MKFKVGDRVRSTSWAAPSTGTIYAKTEGDMFKVKLDSKSVPNHSYFIENKAYCVWQCDSELEPIQLNKILITSDGHTTTARLYDGKKVTKSAEAKCSPSDKFDFSTGAKLAFDRLMGTEKPKEHKPESIKLYCVKEYLPGEWVTRGTIYIEDKDGIVSYDDGYCDNTEGNFSDGISAAPGHLVPLVSRPAQTGEWVLITEPQKVPINEDGTPSYQKGSVLKIIKGNTFGLASFKEGRDVTGQFYNLYDAEYEVLDGYDGRYEEQEKPTYYNGKVVCVETHDVGFVSGAIYSVIGGALRDKDGEFRPFRSGAAFFRKFDDLNRSAYGKFIEFKGEANAE